MTDPVPIVPRHPSFVASELCSYWLEFHRRAVQLESRQQLYGLPYPVSWLMNKLAGLLEDPRPSDNCICTETIVGKPLCCPEHGPHPALAASHTWIDASEQRPEPGTEVLVLTGRRRQVATYEVEDSGRPRWVRDDGMMPSSFDGELVGHRTHLLDVTHWMPLPELP